MPLVLSFFLITILLISCASPSEKVENAKEDVVDANNKLDTAIKNYQADINAYKTETASKIAANELAIKNFNSKIENEKKELRAKYLSKIEVLEKKNRDLKNKLDNYQDDGNDKWRTFKAEFDVEFGSI
jgi:lipopolysaccharide export LptBFGC system permease protein LptF